jgi:hypothetical protein
MEEVSNVPRGVQNKRSDSPGVLRICKMLPSRMRSEDPLVPDEASPCSAHAFYALRNAYFEARPVRRMFCKLVRSMPHPFSQDFSLCRP